MSVMTACGFEESNEYADRDRRPVATAEQLERLLRQIDWTDQFAWSGS